MLPPNEGSHAVASGKVAREAAVFPFKLCHAILRGCSQQLRADGRLHPGQYGVQGLWEERAAEMPDGSEQQSVPEVLALTGTKKRRTVEATLVPYKFFKDSVTGQRLPAELVNAAHRLELEYFEKNHAWDKVQRSQALAKTGN